jgi:general nucleoside transport system ATP-binding protein
MNKPFLSMQGITKNFLRVKANDNINFDLSRGEICSLLGENGAGKSTLMKILSGLYRPDEGRIFMDEEEVIIHEPKDAVNYGIGMVFQHFNLVEDHQVWENIVIGSHSGLLNRKNICRHISQLSAKFGLKVNPEAYVWELSVGEKQRVEIVKALYHSVKILILDEPTAVLTPQEADCLFETLRGLAEQGISIIFISHKLNEVMALTHRVVVLRKGKIVGEVNTTDSSPSLLSQMMIGEMTLDEAVNKDHVTNPEVILEIENVTIRDRWKTSVVNGASFSIHSGEIFGLAGVSGNGQRELAEALNGMRQIDEGEIRYLGENLKNCSTDSLIQRQWARIPEDRMIDGLILDASVSENIILEQYGIETLQKGFFLDTKAIEKFARGIVDSYDIRTPNTDEPVGNLSGGNIQKLILGRELSLEPKVIIAAQPTRGLDVKAINDIRTLLLSWRNKGATILLISEDLQELLDLSDRIGVMFEGRITGVLECADFDINRIGLMMSGIDPKDISESAEGVCLDI